MKKQYNSRLLSAIIAIAFSISGFVSLLVDKLLTPFLESVPELKLIIILISVFFAYHAFLTFTLKDLTFTLKDVIKKEVESINGNLVCIDTKVGVLNDSIPFSYLDDIERRHGEGNKDVNCEMWIIANTLQEAYNSGTKDSSLLNTIYDNITHNKVHYFYVLPHNEKSKLEIASLQSRLKDKQSHLHREITGGVSYKLDNTIDKLIPSEYFDIVLFIDCDEQGTPIIMGDSTSYEGYQCFSSFSKENKYYYQPIDRDTIIKIHTYHKSTDFTVLEIQEASYATL